MPGSYKVTAHLGLRYSGAILNTSRQITLKAYQPVQKRVRHETRWPTCIIAVQTRCPTVAEQGLMSVRVNVCGYVNTDADTGCERQSVKRKQLHRPVSSSGRERSPLPLLSGQRRRNGLEPGKSDRHAHPTSESASALSRRRAHSRQFQNPTARNAHFQAGLSYHFIEGLLQGDPRRGSDAERDCRVKDRVRRIRPGENNAC